MAKPPAPEIVLDISRLLSRVLHMTPTGVDRVELAYAQHLLRMTPDRLGFAALNPLGFYGQIPRAGAERFLDRAAALWSGQLARPKGYVAKRIAAARMLLLTWPRRIKPAAGPRILLQVSPHHLHNEALTARIVARHQAKFVCLLHDLIPIDYPEYARPDGAAAHVKRIRTVAKLADAVLTVSDSTKRSFLPYLQAAGREIPVEVALLGVETAPLPASYAMDAAPYFVCLGTIEPRKNHLLLLNLWRRMAETAAFPQAVPRLVLIGRRGWENENIIDMLDRCAALKAHVEERSNLPDDDMHALVAGARALLMPSFAEGFGLPVAEAIAMGVPVICSDLPAHREAGGNVPDYLDPLDGTGWLAAIAAYADLHSPAQQAQRERRGNWRANDWHDHIASVIDLIDRIGADA